MYCFTGLSSSVTSIVDGAEPVAGADVIDTNFVYFSSAPLIYNPVPTSEIAIAMIKTSSFFN